MTLYMYKFHFWHIVTGCSDSVRCNIDAICSLELMLYWLGRQLGSSV